MNDIGKSQIDVCQKWNTKYVFSPKHFKVGVSSNLQEGILPINGLRHSIVGDTSGWYIWAGEELSDHDDFFLPLHIEHLQNLCPQILKYLGLPPGYRFLLGQDGYEDVWEDLSLLSV
jgi:hypothetical protein